MQGIARSNRYLSIAAGGWPACVVWAGLSVGLAVASGPVLAEISQTPMILAQPPKPNIMFSMDDSGSMNWSDMISGDGYVSEYELRFYSPDFNRIYYNPEITYTPGARYDGQAMGNSDIGRTRVDPYLNNTVVPVSLASVCYRTGTPVFPTFQPYGNYGPTANCRDTRWLSYNTKAARYAFYYRWDGRAYIRTDILPDRQSYPRAATRTDCDAGASCSYAQEIQNFANWFSYYRTRILMTKTVIGLAFLSIDPVTRPESAPRFRVGFSTINVARYNDNPKWLTIREFDTEQKKKFYDNLYGTVPYGGTPLRIHMNRIGEMYEGIMYGFDYANNDPYRLSKNDPTLLSCRPSYHILSTDGYWNDYGVGFGNEDGSDSGYSTRAYGAYDALGASDTLADIAMYYYKTDLRPALANNVASTNARDSATHQHMTTFTIGLGVNGELKYRPDYDSATEGDFYDIKRGVKNWPVPKAERASTVDDLWHAAVNGRGRYLSANDPAQLQKGLVDILKQIGTPDGAASSLAVNGEKITGDTLAYKPGFVGGSWGGYLKAYRLLPDGALGAEVWNAADKLPGPDRRDIKTWQAAGDGSGTSVDFRWQQLTPAQQAALGSEEILNYLRGSDALEAAQGRGSYRNRRSKLGDIVNSSPLYVKDADFGYRKLPEAGGGGTIYAQFLANKKGRRPMAYVGANDGMLHAINAVTGIEEWAFIPNAVYPHLKTLADPAYVHRYFVDGQLTESDAYLGEPPDSGASWLLWLRYAENWKTILMGSTGGGAKAVFAISGERVLWEKSDGIPGTPTYDADMGHVLGEAVVIRLRNGKWAAVYGNGYDSANQKAVLYLVDVETGKEIKKIHTESGGAQAPNGLSTPAFVFNGQREVIAAYAGDLQGNLWGFDLSDVDAAKWRPAFDGKPLFVAKDSHGKVQPIVQQPVLDYHPQGGRLVMFGSGKFFEAADKLGTQTQSVYGIWDKPGAGVVGNRDALQQQTFTTVADGRTLTRNRPNWAEKRGWVVDLPDSGERVVGKPLLIDDILWILSFAPTGNDLCGAGGASQLMGIAYATGGAAANAVFPGLSPDRAARTVMPSLATPTSITLPDGRRKLVINGIDGNAQSIAIAKSNRPPFRTWHQLPNP
ncbi:pilus assembly protein [Paraherbaspirillum soli]|uniref:Pilus assembly protein n=1 Tax=Paraherbaspirillum soli TaxID=631222 RepID=A0ABW0M8J3_9BURK